MFPEVYRGKVTKVADEGIYVTLPDLGVGMEFGPCETGTYVELGDSVLCVQVAGVKEDIVVVSRLMNRYQYEDVSTINVSGSPEHGPTVTVS